MATSTLVLYDTTNQWGWLGELYGMMAANLASHFGSWTAMPVVSYQSGLISQYTATIYIGSTYDEPLPTAFLDDVFVSQKPVIWIYDNIWQLTARYPNFQAEYGWTWTGFDFSQVAAVTYKNQSLKRYAANAAGIMNYTVPGAGVTVLGQCVRSTDSSTFPWALRSSPAGSAGSLTYIGEIPFAYMSEGDRYLIFCDLLFDALAPATVERHRAFVRLEDIDPTYTANELNQFTNYFAAQKIPFGFQIIPQYLDPLGVYNNGTPMSVSLSQVPTLVTALKNMQAKGGTMILHGYTHQYASTPNPFDAVTGNDCEFFRITQNADGTLNYQGPVAEDTSAWAQQRFTNAAAELVKSKMTTTALALPQYLTFPSYAASATDYVAAQAVFGQYYGTNFTRAERSLYFSGWLTPNAPIDNTRFAGQYMPYTVRDVYGTRVLADTLGSVETSAPLRSPSDIIADARRNLVVRDGVASFFFHPYDNINLLKQTVSGLQALGYTFVGPNEL